MVNRYKHKNGNRVLLGIIRIVLFLILSVAAVNIGTIGGNILYENKFDFIRSVDVEYFKSTLNQSLPMIDAVYNSGNISLSFTGELQNIIKGIFGFDLNSPVTILNSQSSVFLCYYNKDYKPFDLAQNDAVDEKKDVIEEKPAEEPTDIEEEKVFKEDASSIVYVEETDKKDAQEEDIIRDYSKSIAISNETKYKINIDELLRQPLKISLDKKGPKILIYHTHTTESYLKNSSQIGVAGIPSWSTNPQNTVVRVGEELAQTLRKKYDIEVIHNGTIHDYPNYNAAYSKSLNTASKILKSYPSVKVVIDLHRDGLSLNSKKLRAVSKINGKNTAQIMFVVGTDQRKNLKHPNWRENLKFALKLQEKLNQISPGITKPVYLSSNRYNQHLSKQALIIEVGGDGNTMDECIESTKYLARAISEIMKGK